MSDLGKIMMTIDGAYDNEATYEPLSIVRYGKACYISRMTTTGNIPREGSDYWKLLTVDGESGLDGYSDIIVATNITVTPDMWYENPDEDSYYRYCADISLDGVMASSIPTVTFALGDASTRELAPVAETDVGVVRIFSVIEITDNVLIASITCANLSTQAEDLLTQSERERLRLDIKALDAKLTEYLELGAITTCGEYSNEETYPYLAIVRYGKACYIATQETKGNVPSEDSEFWNLFSRDGYGVDGADGADGITPVIDEETGNWKYGDTVTNYKAIGRDGVTPLVDKETGNWILDGKKTNLQAIGRDGLDGYSDVVLGTNITVTPDMWEENPDKSNVYGFKADISMEGVMPSSIPTVTFSLNSAPTLELAPVAESLVDKVRIFSTEPLDSDIYVASIVCANRSSVAEDVLTMDEKNRLRQDIHTVNTELLNQIQDVRDKNSIKVSELNTKVEKLDDSVSTLEEEISEDIEILNTKVTEETEALNQRIEDEIQGVANSFTPLFFTNVQVLSSSWTRDTTYPDYPYASKIKNLRGLTDDFLVSVNFNMNEATKGIFAPIVNNSDGVVTLYATDIPSWDFTIPSIKCERVVF